MLPSQVAYSCPVASHSKPSGAHGPYNNNKTSRHTRLHIVNTRTRTCNLIIISSANACRCFLDVHFPLGKSHPDITKSCSRQHLKFGRCNKSQPISHAIIYSCPAHCLLHTHSKNESFQSTHHLLPRPLLQLSSMCSKVMFTWTNGGTVASFRPQTSNPMGRTARKIWEHCTVGNNVTQDKPKRIHTKPRSSLNVCYLSVPYTEHVKHTQ